MVFVHPNPMDSASWLFQMAHFSTWYRTIAVDLPGYGRSPTAASGVSMRDIAAACWSAVDDHSREPAVLVGCSVGAGIVQHMYHVAPERTRALVVSGASYHPTKAFVPRRIAKYQEQGIDYRWDYTLEDFSPAFREGPLAQWLAALFTERNDFADLDSILAMFEAYAVPDPDWLQAELHAPVLIVTGAHDNVHRFAPDLRDRLPDAELVTMPEAGHACQIEQPWVFDAHVLEFLRRRGLHPQ